MAMKLIRNRRSHRVEAFNDSLPVEAAQLARFLAKAGFEDITAVIGPGGESLTHLVEDADASKLRAEWPLLVNGAGLWVGVSNTADELDGAAYLNADGSIYLQKQGTGGSIFCVLRADGGGNLAVADAAGAGIRLTSPDGLVTKVARLSNAGVIEYVD